MQLEREAALRRFNWLYIYMPIMIGGIAIVVLVDVMLWGALSPNIEGTRAFASALADLFIIMTIIPIVLLGGLILLGMIALIAQWRRRDDKATPYSGLHLLFWRLDARLSRLQTRLQMMMPKMAQFVMKIGTITAYIETLLKNMAKFFSRS